MSDDEVLPDAPAISENAEAPKAQDGNAHDPNERTAAQGTSNVKLEDLFKDDDDDDEYPFSSATEPASHGSQSENADHTGRSSADIVGDRNPGPQPAKIDMETMYAFYQRLFPFKYLFQWLNHGIKPSVDFGNREFAFTLQNDAYLRYQSYPTAEGLRKDILRLNPSRFEIGPVYSTNPRDRKSLRKSSAFRPVSKELVFDIDLTDYDDIRTCCEKANICPKCWAFVTMAIKVIDRALRDDFGFEHILWVYSGRRGAHAWVCDQRARNLTDERRKAIAGYLEVVRGGAQSGKRVNLKRPLHPHVERSRNILIPYFRSTILNNQDTFSSSDQAARLLQFIPDKSLKDALQKKWESAPSRGSSSKWSDIDDVAKASGNQGLDTKALLEAKEDIILEYTYPRLDAEVSKKLIHLLKSPFVVHPGTGRVCVPIDVKRVEQFNPLEVPTVAELLDEINAWDMEHRPEATDTKMSAGDEDDGADGDDMKKRRLQDYEKTKLRPYIDYFRTFVASLNRDERASGKREREEDGAGEQGSMDF
ncbi:DNA primase small subunit [Coccidioides immitis RS]|uniref:DNA primase n=1 Tax=Coccidioides immitis (strain RS) TaxID=246410 RepID=J3KFS8_COCIM|nr:DNA primase small subunit [Coccidioides immitis RS]EAS34510.3 DNA primase small subunit [Coccidioides immitis RS]